MNMRLLILFVCLILTSTSYASTNEATEIKQIKQLFSDYMLKYNHFLTTDIMPVKPNLYSDPIMFITGSGNTVSQSSQQMNEQVVKFLSSLKAKGVHKIKWQQLNIRILSSTSAIASNLAGRYLQNGELFNQVGATYFISKAKGHWQISLFTVHDAKQVILFNDAQALY